MTNVENEEVLAEQLEELLNAKQYTKIRQMAEDMNTVDLAALMDEMENEASLRIFRILPKNMAASSTSTASIITIIIILLDDRSPVASPPKTPSR